MDISLDLTLPATARAILYEEDPNNPAANKNMMERILWMVRVKDRGQ
jgi:hypothetical protein